MITIMRKLSAILKSECANTSEFLFLLKRNIKGITILLYANIIYSAIIHLVLTVFPYYPATTMTLKRPK